MNIKINDKFYRYITPVGVFEYIVKGIRSYEGDEQYELECQSCSHGYKCILLAALDDKKQLQYIHTLNDDEEDSQTHWHQESGQFYKTKREVLISQCEKQKRYWNEEVAKAEHLLEQKITSRDREIILWNNMIEGLKE